MFMQQTKLTHTKISKRLKYHFVLSVVLALLTLSGADADAAERAPTVEDLLGQFETVVFRDELNQGQNSDRVIRWEDGLTIRVVGKVTRLNKKILRRHTDHVKRLTGLPIAFVTHAGQSENVTVAFVPALEMAKLPGVTVDQKMLDLLAAPRSCYFLVRSNKQGEINQSVIVVNAELDTASIYHCLLEELIQSMGLPNDTDILRPSIFSDKDRLERISRTDEILVRTLYDPRMRVGTDRNNALRIARTIITDLNTEIPIR